MDVRPRFSERRDLAKRGASINVPVGVREGVLVVACECGVQLAILRAVLWRELRKTTEGGTSTADLLEESRTLMQECDGGGVYDAAEALYEVVAHADLGRARRFEVEVNRLFSSGGVSFQMRDGRVQARKRTGRRLPPDPQPPPCSGRSDPGGAHHQGEATSVRPPLARASPHESHLPPSRSRTVVEWAVGIAERRGARLIARMLSRVVGFIISLTRWH